MSMTFTMRENGTIASLQCGDRTIPFREDAYAGPSLRVVFGGKEYHSEGQYRKISNLLICRVSGYTAEGHVIPQVAKFPYL